ncbi:MAG TPA: pitrilysin family protein [Xanthobacteraceae bacterium]|nr:pitrilysin family protein [Xanthobacteraceae bacterium]
MHLRAAGAEPSYFKLDNGLEVVVIPDHRTPVVTHMVWYKVGSADEPPGQSGIAHFLEHLMFKGTEANPGATFSQTVARFGGQENAFTSTDYTGYFQRVSRERLARLMELEADRMTGLVLDESQVLPERDVVLEEQYQRVANDPASMLGQQVSAALYLNHPYGRPIIGWRHEIEKLDREDALAFYRQYYTPNNAVLVIAGDVTADEVRRLAHDTYGKVKPRAEIGPRLRPQEPEPVAARSVTLADPRVAQPSMQRSYLVPSDTTAAPGEAEALDVLTHILGNGSVSRLYRRLVMEKGIAASAGAWYHSTALDHTRIGIYATPRSGVTLADLETALDGVLHEFVQQGVTPEEIERAKSKMVSEMIYAQDSQATLARIYGAALTTGSSVEKVRTWPDRIRAVTAEAVGAAARRWLDKRRSVTGYLVREDSPPEGKRS